MNTDHPQPLRKPAIVAPVMRFIGVADAARSVAFYRDVLEFDVVESPDDPALVDAVRGPARIQFGNDDLAPDDPRQIRPLGSGDTVLSD